MATQKPERAGYRMDMVHGPLAGKILLFALPLMLSSLLQLLFNAADVVVVGRCAGEAALAAVGSTSSLINLLVNLFVGFSVGTNVVVARDMGSGREEDVRSSVHTAITISLISGVLLAVLGVALARQLLVWTSSTPDVIDLATIYLRIYFAGMPVNMLYNFGSAILRAQGDTRRPLYYLAIAGVTNVALNLLFVIVFRMSVAGVALATIISQAVSALLVLGCLMRDEGPLHLDLRELHLDKRIVKRILQVGLPAGFQGIVFSLSNVVIQSSINSFGSVVVAGNSAGMSIEQFVYISMNAVHQAAVSFTSQNTGAGKPERINRILFSCLGLVTVVGLLMGLGVNLLARPLLSIYSPDAAVIEAGRTRLLWICAPYFLCGVMEIVMGIMRGLGYAFTPMIVSLSGACLFRVVWLATAFAWVPTQNMLLLSYPVSWILTTLIHGLTYLYARRHHDLFQKAALKCI